MVVGGVEPPFRKGYLTRSSAIFPLGKTTTLLNRTLKPMFVALALKMRSEFHFLMNSTLVLGTSLRLSLRITFTYTFLKTTTVTFLLGDGVLKPSPIQERLSDREECFLLVYGLNDLATFYQLTEKCGNLLI